MYDPEHILSWLLANVEGMVRSRAKTLAAITAGAMRMQGTGVLALGRAMQGPTAAKHRIKRVDRFLANEKVELDAVHGAVFHQFRPRRGPTVVLADWTDRFAFQTLVLALPCDGRAIPFYSITVKKSTDSAPQIGSMIAAEREALDTLAQICGDTIRPIIIADRGFGNTRWLGEIQNRGWHFVQRIARNHYVEVEQYVGIVRELGIRRGWKPRDHGVGTLGDKQWGPIRLVSVYSRDANEPWYLVTNLREENAAAIVEFYTRRMWIEAMFRDLKNRDWGLGMDKAKLTQQGRVERHFLILALAYIFLVAFGAAAEAAGLGETLKANTVENRVLSLARIGNYFLQTAQLAIPIAIGALLELPNRIKTGDY
jgi:hypothetical protein